MTRPSINVARRIGAVSASLTLAALLASCAENFTTNPAQLHESLSLTHWADTIVLGDNHNVVGHVTDDLGRPVLQRRIEWTATSVNQYLELTGAAKAQRGPSVPAVVARFDTDSGETLFEAAAGDSVKLVGTHAGFSDVRL